MHHRAVANSRKTNRKLGQAMAMRTETKGVGQARLGISHRTCNGNVDWRTMRTSADTSQAGSKAFTSWTDLEFTAQQMPADDMEALFGVERLGNYYLQLFILLVLISQSLLSVSLEPLFIFVRVGRVIPFV